MFVLKNKKLQIAIHPQGAELQKITSVKNGRDFMWDGNPEIWSWHSPNLFPIVGGLKDGTYFFAGKAYHLPQHGFARHSKDFKLTDESEQLLTLTLEDSEKTQEVYPFKFQFSVTYELLENQIKVSYRVRNTDDQIIYFSVGGHPAFKCPLYPEETYDDYTLRFEKPETSKTHLLNLKNGLFNSKTESVFDTPHTIQLNPHLFDKDALVFTDLNSRKVTLESKKHGDILHFTFEDFPYLGIWAKPNAHFVCIEPWQGHADNENTNQEITEKAGIIALGISETFNVSYTIEIEESHLV